MTDEYREGGIRGRPKQRPESVSRTLKSAKALELRAAGLTYEQIGNELSCDRSTAWRMVNEVCTEWPVENLRELRLIENDRFDRMLRSWLPRALSGDHKAARIVLDISRQRATLNGLNAPTRVEVADALEAEVARLAESLGVYVAEDASTP